MKTNAITDVGVLRTENQDTFYSNEQPIGSLPNLFIVADGMGGHVGGKQASETAIHAIIQYIEKSKEKDIRVLFEQAIKSANSAVFEEASEKNLQGMGTTIVMASIDKDVLSISNVGDSRLYVVSPRAIKQVTKDHSLVEEMIRMGELERSKARLHPEKNVITRAVGAAEDCKADFFKVRLEEEESFLMCSDGLSNMLDDEQIRNIMNSQRDVIEKTQKLVEAANESGGKDNITVVVVEP